MTGAHGGLSVVPRPALLLGLAGLIPFWTGALAPLFAPTLAAEAMPLLLSYAAVILAFMGAVHWGLAMARAPDEAPWLRFGGSVVPPLIGWVALMLPARGALALLAAAFVLLYAADLAAVRVGWAPGWYPALRRLLTAAVVAALAVAFALA